MRQLHPREVRQQRLAGRFSRIPGDTWSFANACYEHDST